MSVHWLIVFAVAPPGKLATMLSAFTSLTDDTADRVRKAEVRDTIKHHMPDGQLACDWLVASFKVDV